MTWESTALRFPAQLQPALAGEGDEDNVAEPAITMDGRAFVTKPSNIDDGSQQCLGRVDGLRARSNIRSSGLRFERTSSITFAQDIQ